MKIKVLKLGQAAKELDVPAGTTVEEAINMSGFSIDGYSVALNGTGANLSAHLQEDNIISLVPKIEGGM
jgi:sulfur carrier protein ThiS